MQPRIIGCIFVYRYIAVLQKQSGLPYFSEYLMGGFHKQLDDGGVCVVAVTQYIYGAVGYGECRCALAHRTCTADQCGDTAWNKRPFAALGHEQFDLTHQLQRDLGNIVRAECRLMPELIIGRPFDI